MQKPNIRFYAGMPIIMPSGKKVGTISVMDQRIYALSPLQQIMFEDLAQLAAQALTKFQQASLTDIKTARPTDLDRPQSGIMSKNIDEKIKVWRKIVEKTAH